MNMDNPGFNSATKGNEEHKFNLLRLDPFSLAGPMPPSLEDALTRSGLDAGF